VRLGYVVDVHGSIDSVPDAIADMGAVDLLVVGGDLTTGGSADDAERAIELWRPFVPRLLALAGNMDSAAIDERLDDLGVALDGRGVSVGDVGICGLSAAPISPLRTPYELDDGELERRIVQAFADVAGARVVVFCPHAPPLETACDRLGSGEHVGSAVIRQFVEREQPDVVLCGHIHEARGEDRVGGSLVVNPGPVSAGHYAVVEIDGGVDVRLDG
jgi:uncharacterized protein